MKKTCPSSCPKMHFMKEGKKKTFVFIQMFQPLIENKEGEEKKP